MILNECIEEGRKGEEELTHEPMMVSAVAVFIVMLMGERAHWLYGPQTHKSPALISRASPEQTLSDVALAWHGYCGG